MSFQPNVSTWTNAIGSAPTPSISQATLTGAGDRLDRDGRRDAARAERSSGQREPACTTRTTSACAPPRPSTTSPETPNAVHTIGGNGRRLQYGRRPRRARRSSRRDASTSTTSEWRLHRRETAARIGNISFIGNDLEPRIAARMKIGHAYALRPSASGGHTNGLPGFGNNNIMFGGGPETRESLLRRAGVPHQRLRHLAAQSRRRLASGPPARARQTRPATSVRRSRSTHCRT